MPHKVLSAERISDSSSAAESSSESGSDSSEGEQENESRPSNTAQQKRKPSSPQPNNAKRLKKSDSTPQKPNGTSSPPERQKGSSPESSSSSSDDDDDESPAQDSSNQPSTSSSKYVTPAETPTANGHATPQTPPQGADAAPQKNTRIKPTWKPPKGFEPASRPSTQPDDLAAFFARDALSGKQLWHITAPASVPLSALAELAPDQLKGHACLSHAGHDYAFRPTPTSGSHMTVPMAPGAGSGFFRAMGSGGFDQELHLHRVLPAEAGAHTAAGKGSGLSGGGRKPREQPKGLRTRWWAAGFEDGREPEERAVASLPGAPQVRRPDSKSAGSSSDEWSSGDDGKASSSDGNSSSDSDDDDDSSDSGSSSKERVAGAENKSSAAKPVGSDARDSSRSSSSSSGSGSDSDDHDSDSDDE